jgi:hypothetical protein
VAVRADKLAFGYLLEDLLPGAFPKVRTDVADLQKAGQVIPLHHFGRESSPAVGAGFAPLQTEQPLSAATLPDASGHARPADTLVPSVIDHRPARLAVGLHAIAARPVDLKFRQRLRFAAARASFHRLAHSFDINIDIGMDLRKEAR